MVRSFGKKLWREESGAVASIYALALPALIAVGGIAFDYTRLAAMDTELQNAADQAALAAVTQLDGRAGAVSRATNAASQLVANSTVFSNDGDGTGVSIASVVFYEDRDGTDVVDPTDADADTRARFVEVTIGAREAFYALTPVVAAFSSGDIDAAAMAGLGSSICRVPPVMVCNPLESAGDDDFNVADYIGFGLKLVSVGNGGGTWAPGNFGYLDTGSSTSNPILELKQALGWVAPPGDCLGQSGVDTRTGANAPVTDALNTRFDIYGQGGPGGGHCPTGGDCPPSINTVKDLVRRANANGNNSCSTGPQGWAEPSKPYLPVSATADLVYNASNKPDIMGHPRDKCHAVRNVTGACTGPVGNGNWDRNAYFDVNYGWNSAAWQTNTGLGSAPTRYQVYRWEIEHRGQTIGGRTILAPRTAAGGGPNAEMDHDRPICSSLQGYGTGMVPEGNNVDRRKISAAVVNCIDNDVGGNSDDVPVLKWIELFLVEPSATRNRTAPQASTGQQEIYVEVIGESSLGSDGGTAGQVVRRDVPYIIR